MTMSSPRIKTGLGLCVALSMSLLTGAASAGDSNRSFDEDFEDQSKSWSEIAVQIPAAPVETNLLEFYVNPGSGHRFEVDSKSISVGADGVVRYTLVGITKGGARNVSYEGIRCATGELKVYAFGHNDGSWGRSRRDGWESISRSDLNLHHVDLRVNYMCEDILVGGTPAQIVERLKARRPRTILN